MNDSLKQDNPPDWAISWINTRNHFLSDEASITDLYLSLDTQKTSEWPKIVAHLFKCASLPLLFLVICFLNEILGLGLTPPFPFSRIGSTVTERTTCLATIVVTCTLYYRYGWMYLGYLEHVAPSTGGLGDLVDTAVALTGITLILVAPLPYVWLPTLTILVFLAGLRYWIARSRLVTPPVMSADLRLQLNAIAVLPEKWCFGLLWTAYIAVITSIAFAIKNGWLTAILIATVIPSQVAYHMIGSPLACARRFLKGIDGATFVSTELNPVFPRWTNAIALSASALLSPFCISFVYFAAVSLYYEPSSRAARTALFLMTLFGCIVPLIAVCIRKGNLQWNDIHVRQRFSRPPIYGTMLVSSIVGWLALISYGVRFDIIILFGAFTLSLAIVNSLTFYTKVSAHCAALSGLLCIVWMIAPHWLPLIFSALSILTWARLWRGRHTVSQSFLGILVGLLSVGLGAAIVASR